MLPSVLVILVLNMGVFLKDTKLPRNEWLFLSFLWAVVVTDTGKPWSVEDGEGAFYFGTKQSFLLLKW